MREREPTAKNEFLVDLDREEEGSGTAMQCEEAAGSSAANYHLDNVVEVWSDFLRPHLHSRSLLMVPGHQHSR